MMKQRSKTTVERITTSVGSVPSLVLHTLIFIAFFILSFEDVLSWDLMFLILTTAVSLEAIYLAIFIQMTINEQSAELDEIQEDIDEIEEDIDEIQEDDVRDAERRSRQSVTLEGLSKDIRQILADLEQMKRDRAQ